MKYIRGYSIDGTILHHSPFNMHSAWSQRCRPRSSLFALLTLSLVPICCGTAVNYTLDDTNFDQRSQGSASVVYSSSGLDAWQQGNDCSFCALKPGASLAFNHTWTDTTFMLGDAGQEAMSVSFVGEH